jgi:hypothetical protein
VPRYDKTVTVQMLICGLIRLSDIIDSYDAAKKDALKTALQNLSTTIILTIKRFLKKPAHTSRQMTRRNILSL